MTRRPASQIDERSSRARPIFALWFALAVLLHALRATADYVPSAIKPPAVPREFRGVWVASVKNIDWPSQPGLTTAQQKTELLAILDRAAALKLNAILLQIRPSCDALYASTLEPWSEYLTGRMGRAPAPFYDPLGFAIEEAHQRGLELHAWLNPFRARHAAGISPLAPNHVSRTRPALVKTYGKSLWLDPGEKEAHDLVVQVVQDLVRRYDIDGVHFDDYFYPYEEPNAAGQILPFPDWSSWKRYKDGGGKLGKEDWRRQNVNSFVLRVGHAIKAQKPGVKFGISPFGIWRPGYPAQIRGLDAYDTIYADARKWFQEGWVDYLAPQLYWPTSRPQQSFPVLLKWWAEQNVRQRHLWPGLALSNDPSEIANQIRLTRRQFGGNGSILWNARVLMQNRKGIADTLAKEVFLETALTPSFPWIYLKPPTAPQLATDANPRFSVRWNTSDAVRPARWLLQVRRGGSWSAEILPGNATSKTWEASAKPEVIALTAINHAGQAGPSTVLERKTEPARPPPPGAR